MVVVQHQMLSECTILHLFVKKISSPPPLTAFGTIRVGMYASSLSLSHKILVFCLDSWHNKIVLPDSWIDLTQLLNRSSILWGKNTKLTFDLFSFRIVYKYYKRIPLRMDASNTFHVLLKNIISYSYCSYIYYI